MNNKYTIPALLLVAGLVVGFLVGNNGSNTNKNSDSASGHMMGGQMMSQGIDQHFITQMIPHHEGAIEMAKIALERSKRPEVLSLANGIIEAQEKESKQMKSWYQEWFGKAVPSQEVGMVHMGGMEGDVTKLKTVAAADFDKEFLNQMIPHHEMAIMMAQMLQGGTERTEMKTLAGQIITSQSKEIEMMRNWLKSWYGTTN